MSMLRTLARRDQIADIVHMHSAPTESDVMFAAELAELQHEPPRLPAAAAHDPEQGRLDLARLDDEVPDWRERQTWACGPEGMLRPQKGLGGGRHRRAAAPGALRGRPHGRCTGEGGTVAFARSGQDGHGGRRDVADGRRRGGRRADAVRLPDGHLPVVCGRPGRTATSVICAPASNTNRAPGYRPAFRRHLAIACSTSKLYWLVTYGFVGYGSVGTQRKEAERWRSPTYRIRASDRRRHREPGRRAGRHPPGHRRLPRRARRALHPPHHRRPARAGGGRPADAGRQLEALGLVGGHRDAGRWPRSSRTWRSATTSCTASGTG